MPLLLLLLTTDTNVPPLSTLAQPYREQSFCTFTIARDDYLPPYLRPWFPPPLAPLREQKFAGKNVYFTCVRTTHRKKRWKFRQEYTARGKRYLILYMLL